jgi:hypothetical protein
MSYVHPAWVEHQRKRWMRPDADRYWRHDRERYFKPGVLDGKSAFERSRAQARDAAHERAFQDELLALRRDHAALRRAFEEVKAALLARKAGFDPNQPRVPAGNSDGGQWTDAGGGGEGNNSATEFSASRRRLGLSGQGTPAQMARFEVANARANDAIARVRAIDPNWKPRPSAYGTGIESEIRRSNELAAEAEGRIGELQRVGIGAGRFASESIPARGPERDFTAQERREINRIGSQTGCHTCGSLSAGTRSGNFVPDHQLPNALNSAGESQRLYPQCIACSDFQGGWIRGNKGAR